MATFLVFRLAVAIYSIQVFAFVQCVKLDLERGEIARGKPITATSTCRASEMYCYSTDEVGHVCDVCNGSNRIEAVTDSHLSSSYWQSAVLFNRSADERVDITINLKHKFLIHQVSVSTAFTPQPSAWLIEGSNNDGRQYTTLAYLVSYSEQCSSVFGLNNTDASNDVCLVQNPVKNWLSEKVEVSFIGRKIIADHLRLRYIHLWKSKDPLSVGDLTRFYTLKTISVEGTPVSDHHRTSVRTKRQACYCSAEGTVGFICNAPNRVCPCKRGYSGKRCNKCYRGRFNYPTCLPCECSPQGSFSSSTCRRVGGQCRCRPFIIGRKCDSCRRGYSGFPSCNWCGCYLKHTTAEGCDIHGKCVCKENYDGKTCGQCKLGYVDFPRCTKLGCTCPSAGSQSIRCDAAGRCDCKEGYAGPKCDRCKIGYYGYPECKQCACHYQGSIFPECDPVSGKCVCKTYRDGRQCDRCESGYFGFPRCQPCECNPYGIAKNAKKRSSLCASGKEKFQCECKSNVAGATCNRCKDLHYSFSPRNPLGCKSCSCFKSGTIGGLESCDQRSGQCSCKPFMEGTKCYECKRGYHSLKSTDIFGCEACKCNPGGSLYGNCDKRNGKCQCRANIAGTRCDRLSKGSVFYPSLHHISVEVEDGKSADEKPVKYDFDLNMFPSYSWKGYVNFSPEQATVSLSINIPRRSLYRILFRCIFEPVGFPTTTDVRFNIGPTRGVSGYSRAVSMKLSSTRNLNRERSSLVTVSQGDIVQEFLMFEGVWDVTIDCESKYLLMDYLVFLPEEYYSGRILSTERVDPCLVDGPKDTICDLYSYPEISDEHAVKHEAEHGYFAKEAWGTEDKLNLKYYSNQNAQKQVNGNRLVLMNNEQNRFAVDLNIPLSGYYIFALHYISHGENFEKIDLYVHRELGSIHIVPCKYQFGCRQVAMKDVKAVKLFDLQKGLTPLNLFTSEKAHIAIDYITAIPFDLWHADYITPALVCRSLQDKCLTSKYEEPTTFNRYRVKSRSVVDSSRPFFGLASNPNKDALLKFQPFFNKKAGNFVLFIQYQQTKNIIVRAQVSITTSGITSRGVAEFKYCPNTEYCRLVAKPSGREEYFRIRQGTTQIEVRFPVKMDVKVSWLYKIPTSSWSDNVLSFTAIDNSKAWVEQCSLNNYVINPREANYCRNSSFALVTSFNNGALPCRCSYYGSKSRYCNPVHGQCPCRRPNIIGRQCLLCRSGYYGFPYCRRCACDPRGVERGNCDHRGRCRCKPNFSGINCDRCKSEYYEFPTCKACDCDREGSLSTFCTTSGQCQCRRGFDGRRCDKCRVGFFGFPNCKECNCHVNGIKPIEGLLSGCNSSLAVECTCKDNVEGKYCDSCKDFYYNLQFNNPSGCQRCSCSGLGTNSQLKNCDKTSGQCSCKSRVAGLDCSVCQDGTTDLKDFSIFGCKGCECNYGGSWDNTCSKTNGVCSCKRNVGGDKCTRVKSDGFYVKTLHHIRAELENGKTDSDSELVIRHNESEFPGFSGQGYVPASSSQSSFDIIMEIPRPTKYRLFIRYVLNSLNFVYGQLTISPTREVDPLPQGYDHVHNVLLKFKPTSTRSKTYAEFLTEDKNGKEAEFFLSRGKWRITLFGAASKLLLDYLVMIPEEYYKATHLRQRVERPCLVDSPSDEYCVDYKYLTVSTDAVNVPTELGQLVGSRTLLPYAPFKSPSVLNPTDNQLYLPLPVQTYGSYVLMVTYYQEDKQVSDLIVGVTAGFSVQTARIRTFYCKYTFGCRQMAIDDEHKVFSFDLFANTRNVLSIGAQTTVALESVTIIPREKWSIEYIVPAEYCVRTSEGCVETTYEIHSKAFRVEAEKDSRGGMRPSLAINPSVRAAYLAGDGVSLRVKSREIEKGRYKILVHYYQPSHGKHKGRIIVQSDRSTALYLTFDHCPNVGGCRALARDKTTDMSRSLYISADVDITVSITPHKIIWIDYILFVPSRHYNPSMEKQQPVSLARRFIKECGKNNFIIDSSSEFCKQSVFTMTTMFNGEITACECDRQGSVSAVCDKFGGQCPCKRNVVGRKCDKCVGGYTGFPNCRRS